MIFYGSHLAQLYAASIQEAQPCFLDTQQFFLCIFGHPPEANLPPRHQDPKMDINLRFPLCLSAFVAIFPAYPG
jgi:hypothetical protein